jgi:hypothetical protein
MLLHRSHRNVILARNTPLEKRQVARQASSTDPVKMVPHALGRLANKLRSYVLDLFQ